MAVKASRSRKKPKARSAKGVPKSKYSPRKTCSKTKNLVLQRPIVVIDLETTGLSLYSDRIIEIACIKLHPDGSRETKTHRVNPQQPIGWQASEVHGIYDADVADCPTFEQLTDELLTYLSGCDLSGFNIESFDLRILKQEFHRANIIFPTESVHVVDTYRIFTRLEPRNLSAAFHFYCNGDLNNAHGAEADANAAADILLAQVRRYEDLPTDVQTLQEFANVKRGDCNNQDKIDPDGKIIWRNEQAVLNFGKHRNCSLKVLVEEEREYLVWITTASFPSAVVEIVRAALKGIFPAWPATIVVDTV